MDEMMEYVTFMVKSKDGNDIEMAVTDEFEFERKNYVVAAVVEGDEIIEDSLYIYKVKPGAEFDVEKITEPGEYERVAEAYATIE